MLLNYINKRLKLTLTKSVAIALYASCFLIILSIHTISASVEKIQIAEFSKMNLQGWKNKSFEGKTEYTIKSDGQQSFLHAESMKSASALYKKVKVNIHETPYLNWTWRVNQMLPKQNEQTKTGDDYAARIYVVFKTGITPLSAKALNYIWSSNDSILPPWPNSYTDKAVMIPLRCSQDKGGSWHKEKVNIKEDLLKHFDKLPKHIDGVAIMTDTDNSGSTASASYGDIYFSSN